MARLAHQLAMLNEHVTADVIDTGVFFDLVHRYQIYATPALVINDRVPVFGFLSEAEVVQHVLHAAGPRPFDTA